MTHRLHQLQSQFREHKCGFPETWGWTHVSPNWPYISLNQKRIWTKPTHYLSRNEWIWAATAHVFTKLRVDLGRSTTISVNWHAALLVSQRAFTKRSYKFDQNRERSQKIPKTKHINTTQQLTMVRNLIRTKAATIIKVTIPPRTRDTGV